MFPLWLEVVYEMDWAGVFLTNSSTKRMVEVSYLTHGKEKMLISAERRDLAYRQRNLFHLLLSRVKFLQGDENDVARNHIQ